MRLSAELENALFGERYEARNVFDETPWLTLPPGYSFKVTFPFTGAAARFRVCKTDNPSRNISVYLDVKDVLGYFGAPYWEAYPIGDSIERFALKDGDRLIAAIIQELERTAAASTPKEAR